MCKIQRIDFWSLTIVVAVLISLHMGCGSTSNNASETTDSEQDEDEFILPSTSIIPFDYTLEDDHVAIQTDGGVLKASIGAYGAHSTPHTGHAEGKMDVDWKGHYAFRFEDLTEVPGIDGNDDGIPDEDETCGIHYTDIDARIPHYISPFDDLRITSVELSIKTDEKILYYEHGNHWGVTGDIGDGALTIGLGHSRSISEDLAKALEAAGYKNPITQLDEIQEGEELITGDPVYLNQGDRICSPQIQGQEIESTGYYDLPVAQMEFTISLFYYYEEGQWGAYYPAFTQDELVEWESLLQNDAANSQSYRYNSEEHHDWLWKAECVLSTLDYIKMDGYYDSITTEPGAWVEGDKDLVPGDPLHDEMFVIFPIIKTSPLTGLPNPFYNADLYHSSDVNYLAYKYKDEGVEHTQDSDFPKWGEVIYPASPDPTSDMLIIKWRTKSLDPPLDEVRYQGLKYYLNSDSEYLTISWTDEFETESATERALLDITVPDDQTIVDGGDVKQYNAFYDY
jgi:hypothetical protein